MSRSVWTIGLLGALLPLAGIGACSSSPTALPAPTVVPDAGMKTHEAGPLPSAGDVPATTACTVAPQGGCPPEHTCVISGSSEEASCYGAGTTPLRSPCMEYFDCVAGSICVPYDACNPVCTADADCKFAGSHCVQLNDANGDPVPGLQACSSQCNPAEPTMGAPFQACGAGSRCDLFNDVTGATACNRAGSGQSGDTCAHPGDCAAGLTCLTDAQTGTASCTEMCLMSDSSACSGGGSCLSFGTTLYVDTGSTMTEVGYCG